jgi:hypothetical protein
MTTVLSPIEFDHLVQVVYHKACGHRAECWCGWASAWCDDYATADETANDHRRVAAGPASALDATLGGLLDLQDDLADAVMWLADHWSSDLPVPELHPRRWRDGSESATGFALAVRCQTSGQLVELAVMLDAPIVIDASPQTPEHSCERAARSFGRVEIEAYTEGNSPGST